MALTLENPNEKIIESNTVADNIESTNLKILILFVSGSWLVGSSTEPKSFLNLNPK
jgi:hypothetical protein